MPFRDPLTPTRSLSRALLGAEEDLTIDRYIFAKQGLLVCLVCLGVRDGGGGGGGERRTEEGFVFTELIGVRLEMLECTCPFSPRKCLSAHECPFSPPSPILLVLNCMCVRVLCP